MSGPAWVAVPRRAQRDGYGLPGSRLGDCVVVNGNGGTTRGVAEKQAWMRREGGGKKSVCCMAFADDYVAIPGWSPQDHQSRCLVLAWLFFYFEHASHCLQVVECRPACGCGVAWGNAQGVGHTGSRGVLVQHGGARDGVGGRGRGSRRQWETSGFRKDKAHQLSKWVYADNSNHPL